jgi:hypothetical protein
LGENLTQIFLILGENLPQSFSDFGRKLPQIFSDFQRKYTSKRFFDPFSHFQKYSPSCFHLFAPPLLILEKQAKTPGLMLYF